jgi:predicted MPP superfamily phosphohydrolase
MKRLLPLFIVSLFIFLLNWYVLSGLHTLSSSPYITPVFWTIITIIIGSVFYAISRMQKHGLDLLFKVSSHIAFTLVISELIMVILLFFGDFYSLIAGTPRNIYWVEACFMLMLFTVFLFVYGMVFGKYNYKVIRHTLHFDDLPESFDGFKLVQISDVHAGSFNNPKAVQKGINMINQQNADLFVFTGDLVNNKAEEIKPWISYFSQIRAPYGQYSILGNHDYGDYIKWDTEADKVNNLDQLKAYHHDLGFKLLLDEHVQIKKDGEYMVLAGVENWGIGFGERGDLKKALANTKESEFKILLSHDPTHWEAQVKSFIPKVQLTLSGHTHGMQFGLEAFGIKWSPVKYRYKHWAGLKSENGSVININRGFGFIGFSGRIGIWPEITVIKLKKSKR